MCDFIVGQIAPYHCLQETCISKLELADGDRILCAGIGTGDEILRILDHKRNVRITGIDYLSLLAPPTYALSSPGNTILIEVQIGHLWFK